MHPAVIVLLVVLGVALLYTILCYIIANGVFKMATRPIAYTFDQSMQSQKQDFNEDFDDYLHNWNKQEFEVDGVHGKIRGEVVFHPEMPNQTRKKVAIVCHGHTCNRINSVKYGSIFYKQGYSLVLYDHAYFGLSDGPYTTLGFNEKFDLSTVIDYTKNLFGQDCFLALHGESMGAVTILCELGLRSDINLLVADCGFSHTMNYYRELCFQIAHVPPFPTVDFANVISTKKIGYDFTKTVPINCVKNSNVPICFIHGASDTFIQPHHSVDMYNVCQNPNSELHLFDGAEHARSIAVDKPRYEQVVCDFIHKIENL